MVNQLDFENKIQEEYFNRKNNKALWDRKQEALVIKHLKEMTDHSVKKSVSHFYS